MSGVKTLSGISTKFCYIVHPSGEAFFRKFPCLCADCLEFQFSQCKFRDLNGIPYLVVKLGENIRKQRELMDSD